MLEYAGVEYDEKLYDVGPPPTMDRSSWLNDKFNLGLDFPNLPYYIDGDFKITQSHVIMRHLANVHNMCGRSEDQRVRADLLASTIYDFHMDYCRTIAYNPDHEKNKADYLKNLADRLKMLVKFIGTKKFVVGDDLTYADFVLYEYLEGQKVYQPEILTDYPTLAEFVKRINELPAVAKYFSSPRAIKAPFNGAPAYIGGQYSDILNKK